MNYNSVNQKLKNQFGCKVYKLALSGGMTCPNRDGKTDTRGCIFCSGGGSGEFAQPFDADIHAQIEKAKLRVDRKIKGERKYIAYFQSFTNTYASPDYLENIFMQAVSHPDIAILSVATRPDCLGEEVLSVLEKVGRIKPLWVELGLQSIHPKTATYIRRGYPLEVYDKAVADLHRIGAQVITHIILGLPYESADMMIESVKYAGSKTDGIKLQLLHVLKNTDLEKDYNNGLFETLSAQQYVDILKECVRVLPPHVVIHRLTGDGAKKDLISPLWSADKKRVLNMITSEFEKDNVIQGEKSV